VLHAPGGRVGDQTIRCTSLGVESATIFKVIVTHTNNRSAEPLFPSGRTTRTFVKVSACSLLFDTGRREKRRRVLVQEDYLGKG